MEIDPYLDAIENIKQKLVSVGDSGYLDSLTYTSMYYFSVPSDRSDDFDSFVSAACPYVIHLSSGMAHKALPRGIDTDQDKPDALSIKICNVMQSQKLRGVVIDSGAEADGLYEFWCSHYETATHLQLALG